MSPASAGVHAEPGASADDWRHGGFGLYVHWPFCQSKCPYCDFNSHVSAQVDHEAWRHAYLAEVRRTAAETADRILSTIFFGGGTPSLMDPATVGSIIDAARSAWPAANDLEVTLEANPTSVEAGRFRAFRAAGVTRVSVGIQALRDADLARLGRRHSVAEALSALEIARRTFDHVSFDIIYARQRQRPEDWARELDEVLALDPTHVSLYQLTIEDGTAFGARHDAGTLRGLPDDDAAADMYLITAEACRAAGLDAYEVSNHARGDAACRHNLIYWRAGDWVGIGPGAHGRLTLGGKRYATEALRSPKAWMDAVSGKGSGECPRGALTIRDQAEEVLMMGLRLSEGVCMNRLKRLGLDFSHGFKHLYDDGLIRTTGGHLVATDRGRMVLNSLTAALLSDPPV